MLYQKPHPALTIFSLHEIRISSTILRKTSVVFLTSRPHLLYTYADQTSLFFKHNRQVSESSIKLITKLSIIDATLSSPNTLLEFQYVSLYSLFFNLTTSNFYFSITFRKHLIPYGTNVTYAPANLSDGMVHNKVSNTQSRFTIGVTEFLLLLLLPGYVNYFSGSGFIKCLFTHSLFNQPL